MTSVFQNGQVVHVTSKMAIWWFCIWLTSKTTLVMKSTLTEIKHGTVGWGIFRIVLWIFPIYPHFPHPHSSPFVIKLHEIETWRDMHASLLHETPDRICLQDITYLSVNYLAIHYPSSIIVYSAASPFICVTFFAIWRLCSLCYVVCEFFCHLFEIQKATNRLDGICICLYFIFSSFPFYLFSSLLFYNH